MLLADVRDCLIIAFVLTAIMLPLWGLGWNRAGQAFVMNSIISLGIGLSIANLYRLVFPVLERRTTNRVVRFLGHAAIATTSVFGGGELALRVLQLIGFDPDQLRPAVVQIGFVVVIVLLAISITYERLKHLARTSELREQEARQMALRAQLEALQARTDPHFLFNTINTIAGLIEEDPQTAERMLERMSSVFRYALSGSKATWVRLEEELRAVNEYLDVEQIRFGDRLRRSTAIEPGTEATLVPPLVLQPLVENAVLHGVAQREQGCAIDIGAARGDGRLHLTVEDDGPGPGGSSHRGNGTSLDNLRQRLRLIYGERATLESGPRDRGGYRVTLSLPLEEPA